MTDVPNGNTLAFRIGNAETEIGRLRDCKAEGRDLDRLGDKVRDIDQDKADGKDVDRLAKEIASMRRVLTTVGIGVLIATVTFALDLISRVNW